MTKEHYNDYAAQVLKDLKSISDSEKELTKYLDIILYGSDEEYYQHHKNDLETIADSLGELVARVWKEKLMLAYMERELKK